MDTMKYNLQDFTNISFAGFDFVVPENTMALISTLSMEVGSPTYIKTPIFQKKDTNDNINAFTSSTSIKPSLNKKRRGNKGMEITTDEWESIRTFQTTKIEQKTGIDGKIDQIRLMLNKLTDKTFLDIREKVLIIMNELIESDVSEEDLTKIGTTIFEFASTNKFYSKIYAELYAILISNYEFLRPVFDKNFNSYLDIFNHVEYVDPDKNYDRFCEINKLNEKRKAVSMFFVNLSITMIIPKESIMEILCKLLKMVWQYVNEDNKKNEVDELTENIAIFLNKEIINTTTHLLGNDKTIKETICYFANSKSKDFKSLSNKAIFKYMDLIDM